ncbi:MAG: hypothetical protein LWW85_07610 [Marinilabiliales bacterium]|nr:hypothetical protein [Marinilabiliales bacterium]
MGHGAWGMEHGAWGMGHGAWRPEEGNRNIGGSFNPFNPFNPFIPFIPFIPFNPLIATGMVLCVPLDQFRI